MVKATINITYDYVNSYLDSFYGVISLVGNREWREGRGGTVGCLK